MITSYAKRDLDAEVDDARRAFEGGRLALIERKAGEHGLLAARERDVDVEYLGVSISLRFNGDGEVLDEDEGLRTRYEGFLLDLESSGLGYLHHEVNSDEERWVIEEVEFAVRKVDFPFFGIEKRGQGFASEERPKAYSAGRLVCPSCDGDEDFDVGLAVEDLVYVRGDGDPREAQPDYDYPETSGRPLRGVECRACGHALGDVLIVLPAADDEKKEGPGE